MYIIVLKQQKKNRIFLLLTLHTYIYIRKRETCALASAAAAAFHFNIRRKSHSNDATLSAPLLRCDQHKTTLLIFYMSLHVSCMCGSFFVLLFSYK